AHVEDRLALAERVRRVARQPARIPEARIVRSRPVADRVADGEVAVVIHRGRAHPAVEAVSGAERALVLDRPVAGRLAELVPANPGAIARRSIGVDGVIPGERLIGAVVPVGGAVHRPVRERVDLHRGPGLRDASTYA